MPSMNKVSIKAEDLDRIEYWVRSNIDLLLQYWECEIPYGALIGKLFAKRILAAKDKQKEEKEYAKRRKMCHEKKAFKFLKQARNAVKFCNKNYNVQMYIYMCPYCGCYHLTSHKQENTLYL